MVGGWASLVLAAVAVLQPLVTTFDIYSDDVINRENNDSAQLFPVQLIPDFSPSYDIDYDSESVSKGGLLC